MRAMKKKSKNRTWLLYGIVVGNRRKKSLFDDILAKALVRVYLRVVRKKRDEFNDLEFWWIEFTLRISINTKFLHSSCKYERIFTCYINLSTTFLFRLSASNLVKFHFHVHPEKKNSTEFILIRIEVFYWSPANVFPLLYLSTQQKSRPNKLSMEEQLPAFCYYYTRTISPYNAITIKHWCV